jgi:1-acyl-sn-glycerol-3-phosphate acyltransferase
MRTILAVLFVVLFLLIGSVILGIEWIIGKKNRYHADMVALRMVQWAFRVILFISGVKMEVKGHEHVPKDEAVLYVGNHRSIFDIITTYSICPGLTGYIAKNSVEKIPLLNFFMKRLYCLFIDRDDMKQSLKVILKAIDQVKAGISICIFPEGTRNKDCKDPLSLLPFKEGSLKIAQKTGCKVIPMAIFGTDEVFENHIPWIHSQKVTIIYGEPIILDELEGEDKKHPGAYCQKVVAEMLKNELQGTRGTGASGIR